MCVIDGDRRHSRDDDDDDCDAMRCEATSSVALGVMARGDARAMGARAMRARAWMVVFFILHARARAASRGHRAVAWWPSSRVASRVQGAGG